MREQSQGWTTRPPSHGHLGREALAGSFQGTKPRAGAGRPCTRLALSGVLAHTARCSKLHVRAPSGPPGLARPVSEPDRPRPRLSPDTPTSPGPPSCRNSCPRFPPHPSLGPGVFLSGGPLAKARVM